MRNWKVIERGEEPPQPPRRMAIPCWGCDREAMMDVVGLPIAMLGGGGIVFDPGPRWMPLVVQCPFCWKTFASEKN